jgi:hypothetical protein
MSEGEEVRRGRGGSSQEIRRLVAEFRTSGMRQSEFCRIHGLRHGTLQRGLKRERMECDGSVRLRLGQEELTLLLGGIDLKQTKTRHWYRKRVLESKNIEKEAGS